MKYDRMPSPAPARISKSFPGVEVIRSASIPAHSIEDATTAKYFALWHCSSVAIELCLWHRLEVLVVDTTDVSSDVDRVRDDCLIVITKTVSFDGSFEVAKTYASPASMQRTVLDAISESRFVTTSPLMPEPTTM